jgi:hypothetical protein
MRRRQVFAAAAKATRELAEKGEWKLPIAPFTVEHASLPRGACQKCGKHIGRGVAMHRKACNG